MMIEIDTKTAKEIMAEMDRDFFSEEALGCILDFYDENAEFDAYSICRNWGEYSPEAFIYENGKYLKSDERLYEDNRKIEILIERVLTQYGNVHKLSNGNILILY